MRSLRSDSARPETGEVLPEEAPTELESLIRRLVAQAARGEPAYAICGTDEAQREILLDIEIDGIRCLLMRVPERANRVQEILSPREQEIARMIAKGYPNKTIAAVLDISCWTVGTYLRRIFAKLGVSTRAAMVARLMEEAQSHDRSRPGEHRPRPGSV